MKDTKTRYQGVYARHSRKCRANDGGRCNCEPMYYGKVYDAASGKRPATKHYPKVEAARNARTDLEAQVRDGELSVAVGGRTTLTAARQQFVRAARAGTARNKWGRIYKPRSIDDIEECLRVHVEPAVLESRRTMGASPLEKVRRKDVQNLVNTLGVTLSGNRVRSIVNALRSLYGWANDQELANIDPARRVRLPAKGTKAITRIVTPAQFAELLDAQQSIDALAYGLAGYACARREQIRYLRWRDVDLVEGTVSLAEEEQAAKTDAAKRTLPLVPPLLSLAKRAYLEAGRPDGDRLVFEPRHSNNRTGLMSAPGLANRVEATWKAAGLERVTLHEARHSGSSWLAGAGIHPKLHSYWMGHKTTTLGLEGGSALTQNVYTHVLWDDLVRAGEQLAAYLAAQQQRAARPAVSFS